MTDPSCGFHSSHWRDSGVSSSTFIPLAFNSVFSCISLSPYVSKSVLSEVRPVAICTDPCPHLDTSESKGYPMTFLGQTVGPGLVRYTRQ